MSSGVDYKLTKTQARLVDLMRDGGRLCWFGDNGPELTGHPFWPQMRTVRALLEAGVLRWKPYENDTQKECGIRELELIDFDGNAITKGAT
jgi:hypothetical protein